MIKLLLINVDDIDFENNFFFFLLDCGPGEWTTIGEYSYSLSANTATWNDARLQCQSIDASQAKITTVSFMKNLLKSSVSTNYWIGGHSPPGRANLQSGWRWDDDSPFSFSSVEWGTFGADGGDGPTSGWSSSQDNCLVWANMEFGDGSCSNQFKYICQKKCKGILKITSNKLGLRCAKHSAQHITSFLLAS